VADSRAWISCLRSKQQHWLAFIRQSTVDDVYHTYITLTQWLYTGSVASSTGRVGQIHAELAKLASSARHYTKHSMRPI